jgi:glyoxylase-like metal-dependent hydrolase (beta-lactamase superfamily II)
MCTHLHYDHVGWNTLWSEGRWVPTFPNARYLFARQDFEYWSSGVDDGNVDLQFAVDPIVQAGLHELVEGDRRITAEVALEPTPGHTPGHVSVRIVSQGQQALITGDFVHHPVQLIEPTWSSKADVDPTLAVHTRARMADGLLADGVLVIGTHFAGPTCGHLVSEGSSRRFEAAAPHGSSDRTSS